MWQPAQLSTLNSTPLGYLLRFVYICAHRATSAPFCVVVCCIHGCSVHWLVLPQMCINRKHHCYCYCTWTRACCTVNVAQTSTFRCGRVGSTTWPGAGRCRRWIVGGRNCQCTLCYICCTSFVFVFVFFVAVIVKHKVKRCTLKYIHIALIWLLMCMHELLRYNCCNNC